VLDPIVPKLVQAIYHIQAPPTPRNDLAEIFLTGLCKKCGPVKADLNSPRLNKDVVKRDIVPAEELRLNMSVAPTASPNRLGVIGGDLQGFPNGRRLGDHVIDIGLQVLEGAATNGPVAALANGDGVNANDSAFGTTFPYVALPHAQDVNQTHAMATLPPGGSGGDGGFFGGHRVPVAAASFAAALVALGLAFVARRRRTVVAS